MLNQAYTTEPDLRKAVLRIYHLRCQLQRVRKLLRFQSILIGLLSGATAIQGNVRVCLATFALALAALLLVHRFTPRDRA